MCCVQVAPGRGTAAPAAPGTSSGRSRTAAWTGTARWAECRKYLQVRGNILLVREPCDGCEVPHPEQDPGGGHRLHQIQGAEQQPGQGPGATEVRIHDLIIKHNNMLGYVICYLIQLYDRSRGRDTTRSAALLGLNRTQSATTISRTAGQVRQYSAVFIAV